MCCGAAIAVASMGPPQPAVGDGRRLTVFDVVQPSSAALKGLDPANAQRLRGSPTAPSPSADDPLPRAPWRPTGGNRRTASRGAATPLAAANRKERGICYRPVSARLTSRTEALGCAIEAPAAARARPRRPP